MRSSFFFNPNRFPLCSIPNPSPFILLVYHETHNSKIKTMHKTEPIPIVKCSPNQISFYYEFPNKRTTSQFADLSYYSVDNSDSPALDENQERAHTGVLSAAAQKNLVRCVERFVYFNKIANERKRKAGKKGKRSLKFITLTLSSRQKHTDNEIRNKLLNQFLTELREKFGLKNYIWKAEKQENGNLHFHILVDVYIHYKQIREIWNRIQNKLGYVDRFREIYEKLTFDDYYFLMIRNGTTATIQQLKDRYERQSRDNFKDPPSTEIRQVEKVRSVHSYFTKYFSKPANVEPGFGRIWYASRTVSHFPAVYEYSTADFWELHKFLKSKYTYHMKEYDYATCWYLDPLQLSFESENGILLKCRDVFNDWSVNFE